VTAGPWLHPPRRAKSGRIRAWLAVLALACGVILGLHVTGKAMQQAAMDAVQWEIGQ
jgi:hypothetical protein